MIRSHTIALLLTSAGLTACAVGPDYQAPKLGLNTAFQAAPAATAALADGDGWWSGFQDAGLERVIARAGAQNLDIQQAGARIGQSRAQARLADAALLPKDEANAGAADVQQSLMSPIGEIGRRLPGFERDYGLYQLGAAASWEIDLFGGLRRQQQAARAEALSVQDQAQAVRISVLAETADAYLQARALQARLVLARRQAQVQDDRVSLISRRAADGVSADRDLNEAEASREEVQASIPPLVAALDAQFNRLDVLMGAQPGTYRAEMLAPAAIPAPPPLSAAEGPAGLLRRRPDVRAAEHKLIAANARIGAALSDYYPKVTLASLIGGESIDSHRVLSSDSIQSQFGVGLRWRLFDFGRVDAEVAGARGRQAEALAGYRSAVLKASEEVEDAFSTLEQDQSRVAALGRQVERLTKARAQAQKAYEGGATGLIEVRDLDREWLSASDQLVLAQASAARAAVAAFRALGGGWSA